MYDKLFSDNLGAIAGEGLTAFGVTAKGADDIRVFHLLIEIPNEGTSSEVTARKLVDRTLFLYSDDNAD